MTVQTLTGATSAGRRAVEIVMATSYRGDIDNAPPEWALARVVDDVPVAYILVDPHRQMMFPGGNLRYAFVCDVATREDRRREGHFRALMEETLPDCARQASRLCSHMGGIHSIASSASTCSRITVLSSSRRNRSRGRWVWKRSKRMKNA